MADKQTRYAVWDTVTEKFISRYTESSGKIYLVKNPFCSNYFFSEGSAQRWLDTKGLDKTRYTVLGFEEGGDRG